MKKAVIKLIIAVVVAALVLAFLQKLVVPKFVTSIPEGSMVEEYYENAGSNDVIFFGDCEAYEVISPVTLWENYGITSYVRGSAQQLVWLSYYLMEDTLLYEKPKVIVFSVCDMVHDDPDSFVNMSEREAYNRMTIDGMKWSSVKWKAIQTSMTSEERGKSGAWSYIFPLLRYHDRILELGEEDWKYLFNKDKVTDNGYLMQVGVKPFTTDYAPKPDADPIFSDMCYEYLDRITALCEDNGIELVLMKSPAKYPIWQKAYDDQIVSYAEEHGLMYINALENEDTYGLDWTTDTYDAGLHLNVYGVEKVTDYVGNILQKAYNLEDHRNDTDLKKIWEEKCSDYHERKAFLEDQIK